jgi:hypothetical protein
MEPIAILCFNLPIGADSFVREIESANIRELKTHISGSRFKVDGELVEFHSTDIDNTLGNFNISCVKKVLDKEDDASSIINSCWSDGRIRPHDRNKGPMAVGFRYNIKDKDSGDNQEFKMYLEINSVDSSRRKKNVSFNANVLDVSLGEDIIVTSNKPYLTCGHTLRREFDVDQMLNSCFRKFSLHQNKTTLDYSYYSKENPNEKSTMVLNLEDTSFSGDSRKLYANIDAMNIEEKGAYGLGLFNIDFSCKKHRKILDIETNQIMNTCLEEATITKKEDVEDELAVAKIGYKMTDPETLLGIEIHVDNVNINKQKADIKLDNFKMDYASGESQFLFEFPQTSLVCNRQDINYDKLNDILLQRQCLKSAKVNSQAGLIYEPEHSGMKVYFTPFKLEYGNEYDRVTGYIKAMQYFVPDYHTNISKIIMNCAMDNKSEVSQSTESFVNGCLKDGRISIGNINYVSHDYKKASKTRDKIKGKKKVKYEKKKLANYANWADEYVRKFQRGEDPFYSEDLSDWMAKDIKIHFNEKNTNLSLWAKEPVFNQEFTIDMQGESHFSIEGDDEFLNIRIDKVKIDKLAIWPNGKDRRGLVKFALKQFTPEDIIKIKDCKDSKDKKCFMLKIKMN